MIEHSSKDGALVAFSHFNGTLTSTPLSYSSNMNERLQTEMSLSTIITSFSTQDYLYVHEGYVNDYQMYLANITQLHCMYRHYLYAYKCILPSPITNMLRIDGYVHRLTKIFILGVDQRKAYHIKARIRIRKITICKFHFYFHVQNRLAKDEQN